jgi:guanyl-specific ribonuclease Sa
MSPRNSTQGLGNVMATAPQLRSSARYSRTSQIKPVLRPPPEFALCDSAVFGYNEVVGVGLVIDNIGWAILHPTDTYLGAIDSCNAGFDQYNPGGLKGPTIQGFGQCLANLTIAPIVNNFTTALSATNVTDSGQAFGQGLAGAALLVFPGAKGALKAPAVGCKVAKGAKAATSAERAVPIGPASANAWATLNRVDAAGSPLPGLKGGSVFNNSDLLLPNTPGITYREWDVNPTIKGAARDEERVVTGIDGSAYWTTDHYKSFVMFRGPTG